MNKSKTRKFSRLQKKIIKPRPSVKKFILFTILVLIILIIIFYLLPSKLVKNQKIVLYGQNKEEYTQILLIDQQNNTLTKLNLPPTTQLDSGYELGTWKLSSLWKLADQEKIGADLIKNTLIKSLHFPVSYYIPGNINYFSQKKIPTILTFIFNKNTDLNLKDKIKISLLVIKIPNSSIIDYNLADTSVLQERQLVTGEQGYIVSSQIPLSVSKLFSQPIFFQNDLKIRLVNRTNSSLPENIIINSLEVLGSKVVSIESAQVQEGLDCIIYANQKEASKLIADIFKCKLKQKTLESPIDIEIEVGEMFINRF